jgi:radical SAM protein with 4Fe4S-binding SPASM domain
MKKFKKIYIEITNVCNLACSFCPRTKRQPGFMDTETFSNILDQIKPYTDYIYFHVKGEPFLHPEIDQLLDISYEKGFYVNITTNGTLIHKVGDRIWMKPALRQINFSIHSLSVNKDYENEEDYLKNILKFINETREKRKILFSLRLWNLNKDNTTNAEVKKNHALLDQLQKEFQLEDQIEESVLPGRGLALAKNVYLNQDYEFTWPALHEEEDNGIGFCHGLRNQVAILVDGTIVPCCLDGEGVINLGNVNTQNFSEIINSERAIAIYEGFSGRYAVEELCRKCGYRKKFGNNR